MQQRPWRTQEPVTPCVYIHQMIKMKEKDVLKFWKLHTYHLHKVASRPCTYGTNDSYSNIIIMNASSSSSSRLSWNFGWNSFKFSWPWLPHLKRLPSPFEELSLSAACLKECSHFESANRPSVVCWKSIFPVSSELVQA